jgi:hypothetical protein
VTSFCLAFSQKLNSNTDANRQESIKRTKKINFQFNQSSDVVALALLVKIETLQNV